ncbi:MAG: FAD-binding protein [Oceanococcus sp.]
MKQAKPQLTGDMSLDIEPALSVLDADQLNWGISTDVLVIGFGAAGAAASLSAREQGREVVILDRFDLGGATARSGGVVYAGGGTAQQRKAGIDDTPEAMFEYLRREVGGAVSDEALRRFCNDSRGLIEWLESLGAQFDAAPNPPKTSYPRDGVYLYYSGNETLSGFKEHAAAAPRGHRTVDKGLSGHRLFQVLHQAVLASGAVVRAPSAARRLVCDESGRVLGVESLEIQAGSPAERRFRRLTRWAEAIHNFAPGLADGLRKRAAAIERQHGRKLLIRARQGVVITTGGFIFNRHMLQQHAPSYLPNMRLGTAGCDGSGIRLGQSIGAGVGQMNKVSAWRFINPPQAWSKGFVVNQQGQRFCNEAAYGARIGVAMCEEQHGKAWLILDRQARRTAVREALFGGLWKFQSMPALILMLIARRAPTIEKLAAKLGMDVPTLAVNLRSYQRAARGEQDDTMGKYREQMLAMDDPSFAALDISSDNPLFPCPAITLGGLRVNEDSGAVLNEQGDNIAGLFAAGRAAVGVASNHYVSGLSLADCLWAGRRAGLHVAQSEK